MRGYHIIPYDSWVPALSSLYIPPWEMKKINFFVKHGGTGGTAAPNRLKASKHKGFIGPGRWSRHFIGGTRIVNQRFLLIGPQILKIFYLVLSHMSI